MNRDRNKIIRPWSGCSWTNYVGWKRGIEKKERKKKKGIELKEKKKKRISKRRERGFGPTDLDNHGPFLKWEVLRHTAAAAAAVEVLVLAIDERHSRTLPLQFIPS